MARIGRKGGAAVSEDRQHMAEIGREGGHRRQALRNASSSDSPSADEKNESGTEEAPSIH
jgi:general stress protein YciG